MQAVWEADSSDFCKCKRVVRVCLACQKRKLCTLCSRSISPNDRAHILVPPQRKWSQNFARGSDQLIQAAHDQHEVDIPFEAMEAPQPKHIDSVRFVGDLNPKSILADPVTVRRALHMRAELVCGSRPPETEFMTTQALSRLETEFNRVCYRVGNV